MDIAKISHPISFSDLISSLSSQTVLFYGDERGKGKPIHMTFAEGGSQDIQFLIGPEGGFSPEEFAILENYSYIKPFTLGPYTLRAETAAIAAIVASRLYFEHWGHPLNSTA